MVRSILNVRVRLTSVAGTLTLRGQAQRKVKIEYESKEDDNRRMPGLWMGVLQIAWSRYRAQEEGYLS